MGKEGKNRSVVRKEKRERDERQKRDVRGHPVNMPTYFSSDRALTHTHHNLGTSPILHFSQVTNHRMVQPGRLSLVKPDGTSSVPVRGVSTDDGCVGGPRVVQNP